MPLTAEPQLLVDCRCKTGENPLWHPTEKRLYWLDIPRGTIFRLDPATAEYEVVYFGEVTGGFTIQEDGALLLFGVGGVVRQFRDGMVTPIMAALPGEAHTRFNDAIADPLGRAISGTMAYDRPGEEGSLYLFERDGSAKRLWGGFHLSNGLGFSPVQRHLYHADSTARTITRYDYDVSTGSLSQPQPFARLADSDGVPDGLTVDAEGFVWLAVWDGARLIRFAPDGAIEREIPFPVKKVSSLTFGGDDAMDIYVTTAGGDEPAENGQGAGGLFGLRLGIRGIPEFQSRVQPAI
jgi:D-xylonolactonase